MAIVCSHLSTAVFLLLPILLANNSKFIGGKIRQIEKAIANQISKTIEKCALYWRCYLQKVLVQANALNFYPTKSKFGIPNLDLVNKIRILYTNCRFGIPKYKFTLPIMYFGIPNLELVYNKIFPSLYTFV